MIIFLGGNEFPPPKNRVAKQRPIIPNSQLLILHYSSFLIREQRSHYGCGIRIFELSDRAISRTRIPMIQAEPTIP